MPYCGCIEDVIELASELQANTFGDSETLHHVQIPILQARRALSVAAQIADSADSGRRLIYRQSNKRASFGSIGVRTNVPFGPGTSGLI